MRARERTDCILIPREAAVAVFSAPSGVGYLAASLRQRMVQTGHVVHALPELGTIRVSELISRPPVFCQGSVTIQRAAQLMTDDHTSAILVRDGENLSILTDAVLRERVVAGEMSAGSPVSLIVRAAVQVGPDRIAVDAVVDMLDAGTDHIVVVDSAKRVLGVLSAADLAGLETRSPFALRHAILSARDEDDLVAAAERLRSALPRAPRRRDRAAPHRARALASGRLDHRAAHRAVDREARPGADGLGVARTRQHCATRVHARLRPRECARL